LRGVASRTMILLDPDLDPDPRPRAPLRGAHRSARAVAPGSAKGGTSAHRTPTVRTLARFLAQAQTVTRLHGRVSVLLTTDRAIRRLNRQFRDIDKATDVLSFPADAAFPGKERIAGDLAISVPTARRQAAAQGHALGTEIKVLILHGLLHLAGYDHETDAGQMARRERLLRDQLGLPQGLIERAHGVAPVKVRRRDSARAVRGAQR
jgi:probable rRNA maturation factor